MPSFSDSFWGEKNNGFDILSQNLKNGQTSSKEFAEFLRESCSVEETYAKLLSKLAKLASNCCSQGSFGPLWQLMKAMTEKLSNLHLQLVHSWQDLIKDVHRYCDEQHKKHKSIKDQEASTLESVRTIQQTTIAVQKSKENYHARCLDFERVKRDNGTTKEIEKAETKCRKAKDDYESLIDKYCNARNDFEKKMRDACQKFQEAEEYHLRQMKDFIETYSTAWEHQHVLQGRCHEEFNANSKEYTVDKLITLFITNKTTGSQIPGAIEFEEADLSSLGAEGANGTDEIPRLEKPSKTPGDLLQFSGFLMKSRREKKKEKKKKKKEKSQVRDQNDDQNQPQVDEEGFSIRPDNPFENHEDRNSWYSSSDSDSDGEERRDKKIKVEIKPLAAFSPNGANGSIPSDNVDVIKQSIQGLRLSPTSNRRPMMGESHMKKSTSLTDSMKGMEFSSPAGGGNASDDLLGLDLFGVHTSSASTPTSSFAFNSNFTTPNTSGQDEGGNMPLKQRSQTPTGGIPLLTGPPPPRSSPRTTLPAKATVRPAGRMSPAFGGSSNQSTGNLSNRADSIGNLNSGATFSTTSMSIGSSRGPSPLTIGMSDNIPLAIAFSETVNVYFKGADESNTKLKLTGDMKVSFPAGIVKVLMDNPSPQPLSFRVKNTSTFEHILVNKQLIQQDASESSSDTAVYQFDMTSLTDHLRRQVEQNRVASYFNIDILKYQVKSGLCMHSIPLHLLCYWKCEQAQTDFRLDYKFNRSQRGALGNVNVLVPVDGEVTHMQSKPTATWSSDNKRAVWKLGDLSEHSEGGGHGTLRAKFDLSDGPSNPRAVAVQFVSEGITMSGVDFELAGPGYRVPLVKKRLVTGKYIAEPESDVKYV